MRYSAVALSAILILAGCGHRASVQTKSVYFFEDSDHNQWCLAPDKAGLDKAKAAVNGIFTIKDGVVSSLSYGGETESGDIFWNDVYQFDASGNITDVVRTADWLAPQKATTEEHYRFVRGTLLSRAKKVLKPDPGIAPDSYTYLDPLRERKLADFSFSPLLKAVAGSCVPDPDS